MAHHDSDGHPGARGLGDEGRLRALPPLGGDACRGRPEGRFSALQRGNKLHIVHFPETARSGSYGSRLRRQRVLGKKCFAPADRLGDGARRGLACRAHADPQANLPRGKVQHVGGAFPSACGKTNLCDARADAEDWTVETVGDDIAWMKFKDEAVSTRSNPRPASSAWPRARARRPTPTRWPRSARNDLHQLREDRRRGRWWEGMTAEPPPTPSTGTATTGRLTPTSCRRTANARFTTRRRSAPLSLQLEDPEGVAIDAFLFGGRRATVVPLVAEAYEWPHGVFLASSWLGEDAAESGGLGDCAFDPSPCCPSADTTGRLLRPLAEDGEQGRPTLPQISCHLVSQGRRGEVHLARLRRQQPRAGVDLPALRRRDRGGRDSHGAGTDRGRDPHGGPRPSSRRDGRAPEGRSRRVARPASADAPALRAVRRRPAERVARAARALEARLEP